MQSAPLMDFVQVPGSLDSTMQGCYNIANIINYLVVLMYYEVLAEKLLMIRAKSLHMKYDKAQSKLEQGTAFALNYLYMQEKGLHPKDISDGLGVSRARIAALLNHMEEQGLVTRESDTEDNRRVIVTLTELGRKKIQEMRRQVLIETAQMLEAIGAEDAQEYIRISEKILDTAK